MKNGHAHIGRDDVDEFRPAGGADRGGEGQGLRLGRKTGQDALIAQRSQIHQSTVTCVATAQDSTRFAQSWLSSGTLSERKGQKLLPTTGGIPLAKGVDHAISEWEGDSIDDGPST